MVMAVWQQRKSSMDCWHCSTELIWGGDHDGEDDEEFLMVTNLSCPACHSDVLVYLPDDTVDGTCANQDSGMQT